MFERITRRRLASPVEGLNRALERCARRKRTLDGSRHIGHFDIEMHYLKSESVRVLERAPLHTNSPPSRSIALHLPKSAVGCPGA